MSLAKETLAERQKLWSEIGNFWSWLDVKAVSLSDSGEFCGSDLNVLVCYEFNKAPIQAMYTVQNQSKHYQNNHAECKRG